MIDKLDYTDFFDDSAMVNRDFLVLFTFMRGEKIVTIVKKTWFFIA